MSDGPPPAFMPAATQRLRRGVAIELIGALLVALSMGSFSLQSLSLFGTRLIWSGAATARWSSLATLVLGLVAMSAGYLTSLRAVGRLAPERRPGLGAILLIAQLCVAPLLFVVPPPAADGTVPGLDQSASALDVILRLLLRALGGLLGPDAAEALRALLPLLVALLSLLIGISLVWAVLGRLTPEQRSRGAWLYAANPLCLLAVVYADHNELTMVALLLFAVYLQLYGLTIWVPFYLALAAYAHWSALLLLPAYLAWAYAARGMRWRVTSDLLAGMLITLILGVLVHGWRVPSLPPIRLAIQTLLGMSPHNSLAAWIARRLGAWSATASLGIPAIEQRTVAAMFGLFAAYMIAMLPRSGDLRDMLRVWGWTYFAWVCLGQVSFQLWSVVVVAGLAAIAPGTKLVRPALLLSLATLVALAQSLAGPLPPGLTRNTPLIVFGLPLVYAVAGYFRKSTVADAGRAAQPARFLQEPR